MLKKHLWIKYLSRRFRTWILMLHLQIHLQIYVNYISAAICYLLCIVNISNRITRIILLIAYSMLDILLPLCTPASSHKPKWLAGYPWHLNESMLRAWDSFRIWPRGLGANLCTASPAHVCPVQWRMNGQSLCSSVQSSSL